MTFTSNFLLYKGTYGVLPPEEYKFTEHQASWQAKILLRLVMKTKNSGFRLLEVSVTKFSVFLGTFLCNIFSFFGFRSLETALGDFFFHYEFLNGFTHLTSLLALSQLVSD